MPRGRKPDGPELQALKGHPRKQRKAGSAAVRSDATTPAVGLKPPAKLVGSAQVVWRDLAPELERLRFLRSTDRNAFARYCDALARWWNVSAELRKEGQTYTSQSAHGDLKRVNPLFLIEERLVKRLTDLEDRFGLTPAARQQILSRAAQGSLGLLPPGSTPPEQDRAEPPPSGPVGMLTQATRH